jgi:membrane-bound lytic murein transglycosylase B
MKKTNAAAALLAFFCAANIAHAAPLSIDPAAATAKHRANTAHKAKAAPAAATAAAAPCRTTGSYEAWRAAFEREALAKGISQRTIYAVAPHLTYDQKIIYIDRGQRVFTQTFLQFSGRMAAAYRIKRGQALIKTRPSRASSSNSACRRR